MNTSICHTPASRAGSGIWALGAHTTAVVCARIRRASTFCRYMQKQALTSVTWNNQNKLMLTKEPNTIEFVDKHDKDKSHICHLRYASIWICPWASPRWRLTSAAIWMNQHNPAIILPVADGSHISEMRRSQTLIATTDYVAVRDPAEREIHPRVTRVKLSSRAPANERWQNATWRSRVTGITAVRRGLAC